MHGRGTPPRTSSTSLRGGRCDPQLLTLHPAPSTLKTAHPQPSTLNPQPSTLHPPPSTLNRQPYTLNPQPSTLNPQPSTGGPALLESLLSVSPACLPPVSRLSPARLPPVSRLSPACLLPVSRLSPACLPLMGGCSSGWSPAGARMGWMHRTEPSTHFQNAVAQGGCTQPQSSKKVCFVDFQS